MLRNLNRKRNQDIKITVINKSHGLTKTISISTKRIEIIISSPLKSLNKKKEYPIHIKFIMLTWKNTLLNNQYCR